MQQDGQRRGDVGDTVDIPIRRIRLGNVQGDGEVGRACSKVTGTSLGDRVHQSIYELRPVAIVVGSGWLRIGGTLVAEDGLDKGGVEVRVASGAGSTTSERGADPVVVHGLGGIDDDRETLS